MNIRNDFPAILKDSNFQAFSMKRSDDNTGGIIKIPDVSAVTASVAQQQQLQQSVFVQRQQPHIEMRPSASSGSQITLPRAHTSVATGSGGVTVYRSDAAGNPPAAHSGGVAVTTTPSAAAASQQPPAAHLTQTSVVSQQAPPPPVPTIKPEQITLPTTPVSLPYGTAVTTTYQAVSAPPMKTLTQPTVQRADQPNSVHPPSIIHKQPAAHQNFPSIRTVSKTQLSSEISSPQLSFKRFVENMGRKCPGHSEASRCKSCNASDCDILTCELEGCEYEEMNLEIARLRENGEYEAAENVPMPLSQRVPTMPPVAPIRPRVISTSEYVPDPPSPEVFPVGPVVPQGPVRRPIPLLPQVPLPQAEPNCYDCAQPFPSSPEPSTSCTSIPCVRVLSFENMVRLLLKIFFLAY